MDRFPDHDIDDNDEPMRRSPRRMEDDPQTFQETLQEARDFHDSWSKSNPYDVWGGNTFSYLPRD
jgi:hypothetical protein